MINEDYVIHKNFKEMDMNRRYFIILMTDENGFFSKDLYGKRFESPSIYSRRNVKNVTLLSNSLYIFEGIYEGDSFTRTSTYFYGLTEKNYIHYPI